jgi:hypothetical protein
MKQQPEQQAQPNSPIEAVYAALEGAVFYDAEQSDVEALLPPLEHVVGVATVRYAVEYVPSLGRSHIARKHAIRPNFQDQPIPAAEKMLHGYHVFVGGPDSEPIADTGSMEVALTAFDDMRRLYRKSSIIAGALIVSRNRTADEYNVGLAVPAHLRQMIGTRCEDFVRGYTDRNPYHPRLRSMDHGARRELLYALTEQGAIRKSPEKIQEFGRRTVQQFFAAGMPSETELVKKLGLDEIEEAQVLHLPIPAPSTPQVRQVA